MNFNKLILLPLFVVLATNAFGQGKVEVPLDGETVIVNTAQIYRPYNIWSATPSAAIVGSGVLKNPTSSVSGWDLNSGIYTPLPYDGKVNFDPKWNYFGGNVAYQFNKDLGCGLATQTNLDETLAALNVGSCWENRTLTGLNDKAMIEEDRAACNCLRDKTPGHSDLEALSKSDAATTFEVAGDNRKTPAQIKLETFDRNVTELRHRMDNNSWGMTFQASVVSDARPDFTSQFTIQTGDLPHHGRDRNSTQGEVATGADSSTTDETGGSVSPSKGLGSLLPGALGRFITENRRGIDARMATGHNGNMFKSSAARAENREADQKINESLAKFAVAKPADPTLLTGEQQFKPGQCIGARTFFAYQQMPTPAIMKEFSDPEKMNPDNWNYKILRSRYNDLIKRPYDVKVNNVEEIALLKEKLKFLERNPLMKNFLQAEEGDLKEYYEVQNIPKERQDVINAAYYTKPLGDRKKSLMAMIQKMVPPADCKTPQCISDYLKKNDISNVKKDLTAFFANPMNAEVTGTENDKANIRIVRDFLKDKDNFMSSRPQDFTYPNIVKNFTDQYGVGSPSDCVSSNPDYVSGGLVKCTKIFISYCKDLDRNAPNIDAFTSNNRLLMDDLDSETANFFEMDIDKNPEFKKFNDEVCNTKRRARETDQDPTKFMTFWDYQKAACKNPSGCNSPKEIEDLRIAYLKSYPVRFDKNSQDAAHIVAFNHFVEKNRVLNLDQKDVQTVVAGRSMDKNVDLNRFNRDAGYEENIFDDTSSRVADTKSFAEPSLANASKDTPKSESKFAESTPQIDEMAAIGQAGVNYAAGAGVSGNLAANNELPKVENMTEPQRQELMDDWQKEYDTWKKNKTANDGSPAASATEAAMQARIQALEQLLAQQKKLTEDQYKLLNDAIANQNKVNNNAIASNDAGNSSSSSGNGRNRSTSAVTGQTDEDDTVSRGPASIANQPQNTAGSKGGAGTAGIGSGPSATRRVSVGGSSDDVAREEAKLVNMRSNSDGSIVISAVNTGSGVSANAISVPVSDDQYRALQSNPQSLNLSQIEKNIPKDQIAKLEKDGEIVILLRNGSNPPFEVKVEKKNNKLVYSLKDKNGKDQAPVRRVFTRQALELQLKANR